jgi:hypothetical protein
VWCYGFAIRRTSSAWPCRRSSADGGAPARTSQASKPTTARQTFRGELARYLALPFYRAMLQASGHGAALKSFDGGAPAPDSLLDALGAIGDRATCRAYVDAYRRAGVTLPAIRPIAFPDAPWYRDTLEELAGA